MGAAPQKPALPPLGKRALWLLSNDELRELNLANNKVGEAQDDANEGLAKLLHTATQLQVLLLGSNLLGELADEVSGWKRQQISRALSSPLWSASYRWNIRCAASVLAAICFPFLPLTFRPPLR